MTKAKQIDLENATREDVIDALAEVNKGCKSGRLQAQSANAAFDLMEKYQGIISLDVRGGAKVANAYKYPHEATGFILRRTESGLTALVSRGTGNDLASWAVVNYDPAIKQQLKDEIGLDRYGQIQRP